MLEVVRMKDHRCDTTDGGDAIEELVERPLRQFKAELECIGAKQRSVVYEHRQRDDVDAHVTLRVEPEKRQSRPGAEAYVAVEPNSRSEEHTSELQSPDH